jgi:drug/metabolite transporter (DMT)-like permease
VSGAGGGAPGTGGAATGGRGPGIRPMMALGLGIVAVSGAAILISLARREGVPALSIAALRMIVAACAVLPFALTRGRAELFALPLRDLGLAALSGVLLALHFAFWISSLDHTSVMSSVVLVSTNPVFVGLASVLLLRERLAPLTIAGMAVAALGAAAIGLSDIGAGGGAQLRGDLLALLGAVSVSGYLLIGRNLRQRISLVPYIAVVYTTAAIVLLAAALVARAPLGGFTARGLLLVVALALGPQLVGHTAFNWALQHVSAVFVTVTVLAEPVGATILALALLGQVPPWISLAGGAVVLVGIWLASRGEARAAAGRDPQGSAGVAPPAKKKSRGL